MLPSSHVLLLLLLPSMGHIWLRARRYAAGTRANANDVDLNRNWLDPSFPFSEYKPGPSTQLTYSEGSYSFI